MSALIVREGSHINDNVEFCLDDIFNSNKKELNLKNPSEPLINIKPPVINFLSKKNTYEEQTEINTDSNK